MKWIDSTDLRSWATRRDCQETLPHLVRKLIRATSNTIQSIKFPSGESVLLGGWDGILEVTEETDYLPAGTSLWEFGASKDPKGKADDDYAKRSANPLGFDPAESTFIFVTPRLWQNGDDWVTEKKKDGIWKDIKVYNAETLEEWIETAPTVGSWLAKHIGKYPQGGIQPTDDFWEEWASGTKIRLNTEILLGGRKAEQDKLIELCKPSSIISVQGISREESLAFIISCFKSNPDIEEDFFSRSIIVDNTDAFRELSVHDKPLILIPRFEDNGVLNRAMQKGHTVIVPLGADSSNSWSNKIILPQIERESFISALAKTGMSKEFAERFSKESARNITILRRQLEFTRTLPSWALPENVSDIIPALIVGRWDENFENDKIIISKIAGDTYENYSKKLTRWLNTHDSPIIKIGSTWRLTSPFDAWTNASKNLTGNDFDLLHKSAIEILSEINPAFQLLPERRHMAAFYGKKREFSGWIREGVIQSLILTSIFGDKLKFNLPLKADLWVDSIIAELLSSDNILLWKSFESKLPLIAEASPAAFLNAIEKQLSFEKSPVASLFEEDRGFLSAQSYHTGLLWALENLAWFPEYLSRASLILAKLSSIDPGGSLSNRPINSLSEIFKTWHPQTLASFEERMQVLKLMTEREPEIGWAILIRLLPDSTGGVAFPTHKTRWRMFELETDKPLTYKEIYDTHASAVDMLISFFDYTEIKLTQLIDESIRLSSPDRAKLLTFIEASISKVTHTDNLAWQKIRDILSHHRSHPDANWSFPGSELNRYEKLYSTLEPKDEIQKTIWLFNEHWPAFPEGYNRKNVTTDNQQQIINEKRIAGLNNIYLKYGIEKIIELSVTVKETWIFGDTSANIIENEAETLLVCQELKNENEKLRFIYGFIGRKSILKGVEWVFALYEKLKQNGADDLALAKLLVPLNQTKQLWDFIDSTNKEIRQEYWARVIPHFWNISTEEKILGLNYLMEFARYNSAIAICSHSVDEIPSTLLVDILEKAATEKSNEQGRLHGYQVEQLFETIDKRGDVEPQKLIRLEWLYLPMLASYGNSRSPKMLHDELSKSPQFFIDVLKWAYKPDNDELLEIENKELSEEQISNTAMQAYELLHSWKKIPGVDDSGVIDNNFLTEWVDKVRELAIAVSRLEVADMTIGQVFAQYPEKAENWPPDELCAIIEKINTDSIKSNFSAATFNKRGSSSRGAFDGGYIEREKADYFYKLASLQKNKFPTITTIFENLAKGYEEDAKRNDEQAERDRLDY